jgi:hypothetical protein
VTKTVIRFFRAPPWCRSDERIIFVAVRVLTHNRQVEQKGEARMEGYRYFFFHHSHGGIECLWGRLEPRLLEAYTNPIHDENLAPPIRNHSWAFWLIYTTQIAEIQSRTHESIEPGQGAACTAGVEVCVHLRQAIKREQNDFSPLADTLIRQVAARGTCASGC